MTTLFAPALQHGLQERGYAGDVVGVARRRVAGEAALAVVQFEIRAGRVAFPPLPRRRLQFGGIGETIGTENIGAKSMKNRIAMWACIGFLVAGCWGFYFANADKGSPIEPLVYALALLTQPIAAVVASYVHLPIGLSWFLVLNAATYALVGLIVETLRPKLNHAN